MAGDPLKRPITPREKLGAARQVVIDKVPYFTSAVLSLIPREAPGLGTFGVTKRAVLLWDPEAVERWKIPEIAAVLCHEIGHVLRDHEGRCCAMGADPKLWNFAGDLEINDDLVAQGWGLPDGPMLPKLFGLKDGLTAEGYYHELRKQAKADQAQGDGDGEGEGGQGDKPQPGGGWCGSGAGRPVPGEPDEGKGPADGRGAADLARVRQETAEAIKEAAEKSRGTVPAGLLRWADAYLKPSRVPWQTKLARACRRAVAFRAGAVDYSYSRPSRRQWGMGVGNGKPILPVMRAPIPQVAVALDCSGSVGDEMIRLAMSELNGILRATGIDVTFLAFDAAIHSTVKVRTWREAAKAIVGGGGTDFQPAFDWVEDHPGGVFVVATDGYAPAPRRPPPKTTVIWLMLGAGLKPPCDWGEVVEVD